MDEKTIEHALQQLEADINGTQTKLNKLNKKISKGKELSTSETRSKALYEKNLESLLKEKEGLNKKLVEASTINNNTTPSATTPATTTTTTKPTNNNSLEKGLEKVEEKAVDAANEMNSEEEKDNKTEDAKSAAETARDRADQIDDNIEENIPTWFWREAQEMSPSDKAKRGFIISNYILNRLGTATGNIGAIIQNAGGSGGAALKEHGGSYIDQYRQSKLEQAMANRKTKQNSLLQQQIDALVAIGASENEARAIQNKLRNSKHWNKYNRLTNAQQVYIQGLLYNDTSGKISDAVLGNFIDRIMEGKDASLEQLATTTLTAAGIDNVDKIKSGATSITDKVLKWLNWK